MRTRKRKLIGNLLLIVCCLVLLWVLEGRPLPGRWQYRVVERGYFLEPKEILYENRETGVAVSRDSDTLYLYRGSQIRENAFRDGMAWGMVFQGDGLDFYAVEESGQAVRAVLAYCLYSKVEHPDLCYTAEAACVDGVFELPVRDQYEMDDETHWRAEVEHQRDIYDDRYYGYRIHSDYELTITFYDAGGKIVGQIVEETV